MRSEEVEAVIRLWHETCVDTYDFIPIERGRSHAERRAFFLERIAPECDLWVVLEAGVIVGFLAIHGSYVDRLYVAPGAQRRCAGTALLTRARALSPGGLALHTHQRNHRARTFYEKHGFRAVRFGVSPPPENEPDVEYRWTPGRRNAP